MIRSSNKPYLRSFAVMKKGELQAVHDEELEQLLKSLQVYDDVVSGKAVCVFCNKTITLKEIQCIIPIDKEIRFCCTNDSCYKSLIEQGEYNV